MFELFLIFCMALIISVIGSRTEIVPPAAVPFVGILAGVLMLLAYTVSF
ncbi:MAG: hypothetical protein FWE68_02015 [Defluviitaleaceae bacterium]|nr:hypothetical protein [Defluviitaleaceae bacterium]